MVENEKQHPQFISLSPRDDLNEEGSINFNPNFEHYESKLLWAIENRKKENIKNIAITGYYGAGKSSILKTFIKTHDKKQNTSSSYKFLELSLATFHDDKEGVDKVKDIEKSLLQQIFYKVEDDQIPNSRLKKISNKINFNFFEQGLICFIVIALLVRFYNLIFGISPFFGFYWIDVGLVITTLFFLLLQVDKINQLSFKKISYRNLEVELEKNKGELSVLSRFLDEIIYFFKETKYNVVVIEDIDRFESTEIFSNLRELNLILNNSDLIDEHIVFIYAIKNEQFKTASDRTKFFDFVIPVIPIVNYETSANLFLNNVGEEVNENMITDLFSLTDDARVIKNTINELKTYLAVLGKENHEEIKKDLTTKLVPLLFYKNVEPNDFSCLLKRKGYIYQVLSKEEIIKIERKDFIKKKIEKIEDEIRKTQEDNLNDINEIKRYVLSSLIVITNQRTNINRDYLGILNDKNNYQGDIISEKDLSEFDNIFNHENFHVRYNPNNGILKITKKTLEDSLGFNILERLDRLKDKSNIKYKRIKISELQNEINIVDKKPLSDLLDKADLYKHLEKIQENDKIKSHIPEFKIIETLILYGYIDNDYILYLSDYTDLNLTFNDHKFWLKIKNRLNIGFHHKLDNPQKISKKLSTSDYNSNAVLNFDFINYCFKNKSRINAKQRSLIIDQISKLEMLEIEFLVSYIGRCDNEKLFINALCNKSIFLWKEISENEKFKPELQQKYFEAIIKYAEVSDIYKFSENSDFKSFLYGHDDFLNISELSGRTTEIIEKLHLVLDKINFDSKEAVLDFIYKNSCYTITRENIFGFYKFKMGEVNPELNQKALTVITEHKAELEVMYNYIFSEDRLRTFVEQIILNNPDNTKEEGSVLLGLLNNVVDVVPYALKAKLIEHEDVVFSKVSMINSENLKLELLKHKKVEPTWDNVLETHKENVTKEDSSIKEAVIHFINQNIDELFEESVEDYTEKIDSIINKLVLDERLTINVLKEILKHFEDKRRLDKDFKKVSKKRLIQLIENGFFKLDNHNLDFLQEQFSMGLAIKLIESESQRDISAVSDLDINDELLLELLDVVDTSLKKELILNFLDSIENDSFDVYDNKVINKIASIYAKSDIFLNAEQSHKLKYAKLDVSSAVKLLNKIIETFSVEEIKEYLSNIDNEKFNEIADDTSRPNIPNDSNNLMLVQKLENKGVISSFNEKYNKIQVFKHSKK